MYARVNAEAVLIDCLAQRPIWAARALETVAPQPKLNERNKIDVDPRLAQIQIGKGRRARRKRFIRRLRQQLTLIRLRPREEFERAALDRCSFCWFYPEFF